MSHVIFGMLVITGRVTMLGLSRWTDKGGSYRTIQRFYHTVLPWTKMLWTFFVKLIWRPEDEYLLACDEVIASKAGKETYGLDRFFSSLYQRPILGLSFFTFSVVNVREERSYPIQITQIVKSAAEKAASQARAQQRQAKATAEKRKPGRPKGSKNKNKQEMVLAMVAAARARLPQPTWAQRALAHLTPHAARRTHLMCADMERLPLAPNSVNLAWSSLALQWAHDLEATFRGFHPVLAPGGLLMFATFGPDTLKELRAAFSSIDDAPHVNHFIDLHDIGDMLIHAGFASPVMEMEMLTLTYADLKALMRDLKGIGAHNAAANGRRGLLGKSAWARLQQAYESNRVEGRLPATFEVIYFPSNSYGTVFAEKVRAQNILQPPPVLNPVFIVPAGGELFTTGSVVQITWNRQAAPGIAAARLEYSSGILTNFSETMENGVNGWVVTQTGGSLNWAQVSTVSHSSSRSWFATNQWTVTQQYLRSPRVTVTTGALLSFWHRYNLETDFDGGVVEISSDGSVWTDLGSLSTQNGYDSAISSGYGSPIAGRMAFTGNSGNFRQTLIPLDSYVGRNVYISG